MNVAGTLNSFSNTTSNSTISREEKIVRKEKAEKLSTSLVENPYKASGVTDTLWQSFVKLSQPLSLYNQKYLEDRLFSDADFDTNWEEKLSALHSEISQKKSTLNISDLIQEKNRILSHFGEPPMSPHDEKSLIDQVRLHQKYQISVIDGLRAVTDNNSYKPLELAA